MKNLFLLVIFCLSFSGTTAKMVSNEEGTMSKVFFVQNHRVATYSYFADGDIDEVTGNIPDGEVKVFDKDNKLIQKTNYRNNKRNGLYRELFDDGELKFKANYKDDKLQGIAYEYYDTGEVNFKWNYRDDLKDGTSYELDEDGKIIRVLMFEKGKELDVRPFNEKVVR